MANVFAGDNALTNFGGQYPAGIALLNSVTAGGSASCGICFVNYANGNGGDYRLTSTSPYKNAGTDGKDLGQTSTP